MSVYRSPLCLNIELPHAIYFFLFQIRTSNYISDQWIQFGIGCAFDQRSCWERKCERGRATCDFKAISKKSFWSRSPIRYLEFELLLFLIFQFTIHRNNWNWFSSFLAKWQKLTFLRNYIRFIFLKRQWIFNLLFLLSAVYCYCYLWFMLLAACFISVSFFEFIGGRSVRGRLCSGSFWPCQVMFTHEIIAF